MEAPSSLLQNSQKLKILAAIAEHLNREVHLQPMLEGTLRLLMELLGLRTGWIFLLDEEGRFRLAAALWLPPALEAEDQAALRWVPCRCQLNLLRGGLQAPVNILGCERLEQVRRRLEEEGEAAEAQVGGLRLHVTVPLRTEDRPLGLLNLARPGLEPLDEETLTLLHLVANSLAVAIERAQLQAKLEALHREEIESAQALAQRLLGLVDLEAIGREVLAVLKPRLEPDAFGIYTVDPSRTFLELVAGWGWREAWVGQLRLPLEPPESSGAAWAVHTRSPLLKDHTQPHPSQTPEVTRGAGVKQSLHLPMIAGERCVGVLTLDYLTLRPLAEEDLRFAALIANVAAMALERALEYSRYRLLFEEVPVGLYRSTPEGRLLEVNGALVRILGYPSREALLAANAKDLYANPEDRARWQERMDQEGAVLGFEVQWKRWDGRRVWIRESARTIRDAAGRPAYYEGSAEDITARKELEDNLLYLASHDPLTGLYNRRRFQEELDRLLAQARRSSQKGAVLLLDLDQFKEVNDRLGHGAGDELLKGVAHTLQAALREGAFLARLGGDEFGVLAFPSGLEEALALGARILEVLQVQALPLGEGIFRLGGSLGIALFPDHGATAEEVLAHADLAMYRAKGQGGGRAVAYSRGLVLEEENLGRTGWWERLQAALAEGRVVAYAQPILDLNQDRITQWELLVRLMEGEKVLPPSAFLPAAERLGLVQALDLAIWRQALAFLASRGEVLVHVNLSPRTLWDERAMATLLDEVRQRPNLARWLVVEVTESQVLVNPILVENAFKELKVLGCKLALDDFGVGFSSLYRLRHLPVDYLKIDESFIRHLRMDHQDRHIVRTLADLARGLGRHSIAEGVEDAETLEILRALGVDYAQGYYLSQPKPLDAVP